ncbi:hypothetical protein CapIbe_010079 [Capra ibex]
MMNAPGWILYHLSHQGSPSETIRKGQVQDSRFWNVFLDDIGHAERGSGKRLSGKRQAPHPEQRAFLETLSDGPQHLTRECVLVRSIV